ncbi:galactose-specific lectin nattectin-like, partial [Coregonus clupeaformis]|uniref:galactose-specific lectin nattectin-like n=1 Tax=Coregonus clupeaformis TaxID=59861 RepID=UPI001E1C6584
FNNRCFKHFASQLDWADAESYCVTHGANLASVNSKGEFGFVKNLIHGFDPAESNTWIGLSDLHKEGRWMWSDGSKVVYTFWSPNEPNNLSGSENCVHTNNLKEKLWNDTLCSNKYAFVCATRPGL